MFSNTVKITDLNDYLQPSKECVKILPLPPKAGSKGVKIELDNNLFDNDLGDFLLQPKKVVRPNLIIPKLKADALAIGKVNLYDCLACSGCVTTSEVVLMRDQGLDNFKLMAQDVKDGVFMLSPESRVSLACWLQMDQRLFVAKLTKFLGKFNIRHVIDMSFFIEVSSYLCAHELKSNLQQDKKVPLITSECPGWICYLEKVLSEKFVQNASKVKSAQMIAGMITKKFFHLIRNHQNLPEWNPTVMNTEWFSEENENSNGWDQVFVGSIQPCADKKLEPMRGEMHINEKKSIDMVFITSEIQELITESRYFHFFHSNNYFYRAEWDLITITDEERFLFNFQEVYESFLAAYGVDGRILSELELSRQKMVQFDIRAYSNKASPGLYSVVSLLGDDSLLESDLVFEQRKNENFSDASVTLAEGREIKIAKVYGFKNIQNVVRQLKLNRCTYDFIEILACPSGCTNGGNPFFFRI